MSPRSGRIPVVDVQPTIDCGRFPAKAVVGETFTVSATVFREGHDAVAAGVVLAPAGAVPSGKGKSTLPLVPMRLVDPGFDRWAADVTPDAEGDWTFHIEAWDDPLGTWYHAAEIKIPAGLDVELVLEEGARLFERAAKQAPKGAPRDLLADVVTALRDASRPAEVRLDAALASDVRALLERYPLRELVTRSAKLPVQVDRERALYGSWYEFFPRSEGADVSVTPPISGTFASATHRLPAVAAMGFDVLYLPPVHPIGRTFRKGANNTLTPSATDCGVPWAIGSADGGHDAIHPDLGTIDDFDAFVAAANGLGLEIALDLALQASPDHPWVTAHPEWFTTRADGTIAYAENPPKKYQDIFPLNFDNDPEGLYREVLRIVRFWIGHGIRIFRVDNPHTKPVAMWDRLFHELRATDPDVLFLAEAFTRPAMMAELGKVGFHQSYTYFTWRNTKYELTEYFTELSRRTDAVFRPNAFVNTPDILPTFLQYGGPPAFKIRATLAATLAPTWGVYAGFELYEHVAVRPGSEEYLDSEKYQLRPRDWAAAEAEGRSLAPYLTQLNQIRRAHPSLHRLRNLRFHGTESDSIIAYSKIEPSPDGVDDIIIVVVNLDPHGAREAVVNLDLPALGMAWSETFSVHDLVTGNTFLWGQRNYVRLDPFVEPAHILHVRRSAP